MTDAVYLATPVQAASVASVSQISGKTPTTKVQTDTQGASSHRRKRKQPASIEVTLSQRALNRAVDLEVEIYEDGENLYERQQAAIDGEADVIERKPKIMTYKRNAKAVYVNEEAGSLIFDFYV